MTLACNENSGNASLYPCLIAYNVYVGLRDAEAVEISWGGD